MGNRRRTYKEQLLIYFAGVFVIFTMVLVIFQVKMDKRYKIDMLKEQLSGYADIIAKSDDYNGVISMFPVELRVSVLDNGGRVSFDSEADEGIFTDHSMRPEIIMAMRGDDGFSIRESETTGRSYCYYAKSYGKYIVRVALPYEINVRRSFQPNSMFLILVFSLFVVALFSLIFFADQFGQGISKLHRLAEAAEAGKVDSESLSFPDSELGEIGEKILEGYRKLEHSNRIIAMERERLQLHIHFYENGIAIFSPEKKKVFSNSKFVQYVNALMDRPTPDLDDIWKSEAFAPVNEFFRANTPVETDIAPVFQFKADKGGRIYGIQILIYPDHGCEITISDMSESERNRQLKQQMTNNIAHELRTPVSSIRGYLETLSECPDIDRKRGQVFIDRAYAQSLRLSDLIRDIALITKIEEAPDQLQTEAVDLRSVADEVFEEFRLQIDRKKVSVENLLDSSLRIKGNGTLIYAVFRNLVENSLKYAGEGVSIHLECYSRSDGYCHFTYYDTGKGVDDAHLTRIFERFYRVSEGRTREAGGSGLGLSIVRNAIAFHKGDIRAVSRKDGGLEFIFSLSEDCSR